MELELFGGLRAISDGTEIDLGGPRQRFVLALLAIECNRPVATERLIELVWPDAQDKKLSSLQAYISNLRKLLEAPTLGGAGRKPGHDARLVRQPPGYRLVLERAAVDVLRFEDLVVVGRQHVEAGRTAEGLAALTDAVALWTGGPLPEFADEPVVVHATSRWHGMLAVALEAAAQLRLDAGDAQGALMMIEERLDEFPLRERLRGLAALGLYRSGRQAEALRLIDRARQTFVESAGLSLGDELVDLERRILVQDPSLQLSSGPPTLGHEAMMLPAAPDLPTLIGRDAELDTLRSALAGAAMSRGGVVLVNGPAAIGKTVLVEHFAEHATAVGCTVAWARCPHDAAAPPFWPLVQIETELRELGSLSEASAHIWGDAQPDPFLFAQRMSGV